MRNAAVSMFLSEGDADLEVDAAAVKGLAPQATVRAPSRDRVTSPVQATMERHTAIPSSRPTSVPDVDTSELAGMLSLRDTSAVSMVFADAVPVREHALAHIQDVSFQAAFLLAHVDGCSTVGEIARQAQLPLSTAVSAFQEMFGLGIVTLMNDASAPPPPSGVYCSVSRRARSAE